VRTTQPALPGDDEKMPSRLLTPDEVAEYLGVPVKTLAQWRSDRHGPLPLRIGRYIRYRVTDLDTWVQGQADQAKNWMAS
jgi:excisionase family DNA binding protein